jgi:hypothetical protein
MDRDGLVLLGLPRILVLLQLVETRNQLGTSSWIIFELIIRRYFFCKWYVQTGNIYIYPDKSCLFIHITCKKSKSLIVYNIQTGDLCIYSIYITITLYRYYYNESKENHWKTLWVHSDTDPIPGNGTWSGQIKWVARPQPDQLNWPESKPVLSCVFFFRKIRGI